MDNDVIAATLIAAITGLIIALTALITAVGTLWHSFHVSEKAAVIAEKVVKLENGGPHTNGGTDAGS